jgi:thiamine pyrophosphokinase
MRHAIVFAGGDAPGRAEVAGLEAAAIVIAADSGFDHAVSMGFDCDVLIGDLDSISEAGLELARSGDVEILHHDVDKDQTDLELALAAALERAATHITVVGAAGGRADHFLANVAALGAASLADVEVDARLGGSRLRVVRNDCRLDVRPGDLVSILAFGQVASGVSTTGLKWELDYATIDPSSSRGISNVVVSSPAKVAVRQGVLLVFESAPPAT